MTAYIFKELAFHIFCNYGKIANILIDHSCCCVCNDSVFYFDDASGFNICRNCGCGDGSCTEKCELCGETYNISCENFYVMHTHKVYARDEIQGITQICQRCSDNLNYTFDALKKEYEEKYKLYMHLLSSNGNPDVSSYCKNLLVMVTKHKEKMEVERLVKFTNDRCLDYDF